VACVGVLPAGLPHCILHLCMTSAYTYHSLLLLASNLHWHLQLT